MEESFFGIKPQFPEQEQLKCPRCDSMNTKFCYYNNYNLSQPRHFCKNCRRYWTKGGSLRNIPVGGSSRKNSKKPSNPKRQSSGQDRDPGHKNGASSFPGQQSGHDLVSIDPQMLDMNGSFSSLLNSNDQYGSFLEGLNPNRSGVKMVQMGDSVDPGKNGSDGYSGMQSGDSSCWGGGVSHGWPDLAIFTPSSNFQ